MNNESKMFNVKSTLRQRHHQFLAPFLFDVAFWIRDKFNVCSAHSTEPNNSF